MSAASLNGVTLPPTLEQMDAILNLIQRERSGQSNDVVIEEAIDNADHEVDRIATELIATLASRATQAESSIAELSQQVSALDHLNPQEEIARQLKEQIVRIRQLISQGNANVQLGKEELERRKIEKQQLRASFSALNAALRMKESSSTVNYIYDIGGRISNTIGSKK